MRGSGVGHIDFMLFVFISFALVSQRKLSFQWNMGFTKTLRNLNPLFHFYLETECRLFPPVTIFLDLFPFAGYFFNASD